MRTIQRILMMIYNKIAVMATIAKCFGVVMVLFCCGVAIHYLCICLPRHLEIKESNTYYQNMGIDYLGLIVAIFAVIITLLVAWQIYSTIKAKNDISDYENNLKSEYNEYKKKLTSITKDKLSAVDKRLSSLEDCCVSRQTEINELRKELSEKMAVIEAHSLMNSANLYINAAEKSDKRFKDRIYENAYKAIIDALEQFYNGNDYSEIRHCIDIATNCLNGIKSANGIFTEIVYVDSISKLKALAADESLLRASLKERINALIELQQRLSYKSTMESIIDFVISVQKKDDNIK